MDVDSALYKFRITTNRYSKRENVRALANIIHATLSPLHLESGIPYLSQRRKRNGVVSFDFATTDFFVGKLGYALKEKGISQEIQQKSLEGFRTYAIQLTANDGPHCNEVPQQALNLLKERGALTGHKITTVSTGTKDTKQLLFQAPPKDAEDLKEMLRKIDPSHAIVVEHPRPNQNGQQQCLMACSH